MIDTNHYVRLSLWHLVNMAPDKKQLVKIPFPSTPHNSTSYNFNITRTHNSLKMRKKIFVIIKLKIVGIVPNNNYVHSAWGAMDASVPSSISAIISLNGPEAKCAAKASGPVYTSKTANFTA